LSLFGHPERFLDSDDAERFVACANQAYFGDCDFTVDAMGSFSSDAVFSS